MTLRPWPRASVTAEARYAPHADAVLVFFAERTLDPRLALDLTTDTFARAVRRRAPADEDEACARLLRIAHAKYDRFVRCGDVGRRHRRGPRAVHSDGDVQRVRQLAALDNRERAVAAQVGTLPAVHRAAVALRVVDGLPYSEVADRLGVSVPTARGRVLRGLHLLRDVG